MGNKLLRYEAGQNVHDWEEMSDSGDLTTFEASFAPISRVNGDPTVAPYGVLTGLVVSVDTGTNDSVSVSAGTVMAPGMTGADADGVVSIAADADVAVTRAVSTDTHIINSITIDSTGAIAVVAGTDSTSFSETRGAAGGPPFIPVGSIEIAQVRMTSNTAAEVLASEIKQVPGTHRELSGLPVYSIDYATGEVTFSSALPAIHTGGVAKKVYIKGESPEFAKLARATDWSPAKQSYSVSSTDTYDGAVGSTSRSLGQAGFTVLGDDGISDVVAQIEGQNLWFEFRPDEDKLLPKQLTQGTLGISWTSPAGSGKVSITCTLSADQATTDVRA
jgi:hypothetical protein